MRALESTAETGPDAQGEGGRVFLFLQGPITPFFKLIADNLESRGHQVRRINLCFGDWLFWRRSGASNYRGKLQDWPAFIADFLDREAITDLILLGEQRAYHKAAIAAAKARDIQVVTSDFGYLRPDWITWELDGMSAASSFPRDPDRIRTLAARAPAPDLERRFVDSFFNQVIWDMLYHLSSTLLRILYPFYRSHQIYHPILVYLGTGFHLLRTRLGAARSRELVTRLASGTSTYFVFPLQMQNDFQLRVYSDYPSLEACIREVVASFAQHAPADATLVIKEHPLDPNMVNWRRVCNRIATEYGVAERMHFLNGGSLEALLENARGVVTINSTVGIWALLAGRPLIVLGEAVYDVPGLTCQEPLDRFWEKPPEPDLALRDDYLRAMAGTIQLRGVYYNQPGLDAAVAEAADRLDRNLVNQPLQAPATHFVDNRIRHASG